MNQPGYAQGIGMFQILLFRDTLIVDNKPASGNGVHRISGLRQIMGIMVTFGRDHHLSVKAPRAGVVKLMTGWLRQNSGNTG
jgi:hypothetical protein